MSRSRTFCAACYDGVLIKIPEHSWRQPLEQYWPRADESLVNDYGTFSVVLRSAMHTHRPRMRTETARFTLETTMISQWMLLMRIANVLQQRRNSILYGQVLKMGSYAGIFLP